MDDIDKMIEALTALRAEQESNRGGWMAAINEARHDIEEATHALDAINATLNRLLGAVDTLVTMRAQPPPGQETPGVNDEPRGGAGVTLIIHGYLRRLRRPDLAGPRVYGMDQFPKRLTFCSEQVIGHGDGGAICERWRSHGPSFEPQDLAMHSRGFDFERDHGPNRWYSRPPAMGSP